VVLLSAGIGATPVLAMLHTLAAVRSTRQVLWLYATRDRQHHPFAAEVRRLMLALAHGRRYVCYSKPGPRDKMGEDFDAAGHLSRSVFDEVGIPREADVYLCGPTRFMADMKEALAASGVALERIQVEIFNGSESMTPGVVGGSPCSQGRRQYRSAGIIRAKWHRRTLEGLGLPEHFRARRGVRRSGPLVVPHGCLSQL
jgi:ferredoxin-NADP reductase